MTRHHQFTKETTHLELITPCHESQMNEAIQAQINLGDYNRQEQAKAIGIGKILGENINIRDFRTNRGKSSPYTSKDAIGEDGMKTITSSTL